MMSQTKGHLVIGSDEICFEPMRGFRTKVMTSLKPSSTNTISDRSSLDLSQYATSVDGVKATQGIVISVRSIIGLKKTRSFGLGLVGTDGLEFKIQGGEVSSG